MPAWAWYEWLLRIAGALIIALGIGMAIWSIRGDRSRGRRRCPKCWYDMSAAAAASADDGTEQFTCPECGRRIVGAAGLLRPRRFWRRAACFLLLACFGWQIGWLGTAGREGFKAFVPTVVLIALENNFAEAQTARRAVWLRLAGGVVTPWDRWLASMRELHSTRIDWHALVLRREKWPVDRPLRVRLGDTRLPSGFETRWVQMHSTESSQIAEVLIPPVGGSRGTPIEPTWFLDLPAPMPGPNTYELTLRVKGEHGAARSRLLRVHVEGVPTIDDIMQPDDSWSTTMHMVDCLGWRMEFPPDGPVVVVSLSSLWPLRSVRHCYGFVATLYYGSEPIGRSSSNWAVSSFAAVRIQLPASAQDQRSVELDLDNLWLELTPAAEAALHLPIVERYWAGSYRCRLRDLPLHGLPPGTPLLDARSLETLPTDLNTYRQTLTSLPPNTPWLRPRQPATGGTPQIPAEAQPE